MLGTLLDRLTGYFSKYFLIGSFFPVFFAAVINGVLAHAQFPSFRTFVAHYLELPAGRQAFYGFAGLVLVAVAAYLLSTIKHYLREILEGEHWPDRSLIRYFLTDPFLESENTRLQRCDQELETARRGRRKVRQAALLEALASARGKGKEKGGAPTYDPTKNQAIVQLEAERYRGASIEASNLTEAVTALAAALESGDADDNDPLDRDQQRLMAIIQYATTKWNDEYIAAFGRRGALFGETAVRPTRFGNIAETILSYAATRYMMNLEAFWTRLQPILQKNQSFFADLQETKSQLDFMVTMFWLTAVTVLLWLAVIAVTGHGILLFLLIAVGGPLFAWLWYSLGFTNYLAFAQMVRSGIDLNRFDLLRALHVPLPAGLEQERRLWDALSQLAQYGELPPLTYQHGQGS